MNIHLDGERIFTTRFFMCVCMCVCVRARACVCVCENMYHSQHGKLKRHGPLRVRCCVCVCIYICIHIYIHVYVHMYIHMDIYIYTEGDRGGERENVCHSPDGQPRQHGPLRIRCYMCVCVCACVRVNICK